MNIGVVFWGESDGLGSQTIQIMEELGHNSRSIHYLDKLPTGLDVIFTYGPFGTLVPLAKQLIACPEAERPHLIWWITEQLPNPTLPDWFTARAGHVRSRLERAAYRPGRDGRWQLRDPLGWATKKAHRFRYYGDLHWLKNAGVLSRLVTGSPWRGEYLQARGFTPYIPPSPTYRPDWGADLGLERDIPVLWLGKTATARRRRLLAKVQNDLSVRGVQMMVVDGVENAYVFGEARTRLLNRTKVVLNLQRTTWDNHVGRFALAAQNRALVVSEPTLAHSSFVPGEHYVEAEVDDLADTICRYLEHEAERREIADRAHKLIYSHSRADVMTQLLASLGPCTYLS